MKFTDVTPAEPRGRQTHGFTRLDLLGLLLGIALLGGLLGSALAASRPATDREQCQANLKTIGQAFASFTEDHLQRKPWRLTKEEGGTYGEPVAGMAWVQFYMLTNYLADPKVLACPADKSNPAANWGRMEGGFLHVKHRANAISYFVGIDVQPNAPKSLLSGDRNLYASAGNQECDYARVKTASSLKPGDANVKWSPGLHRDPGNILFNDGSVHALSSEALRAALPNTKAFHEDNHILIPR